jgi:hypothetical protein
MEPRCPTCGASMVRKSRARLILVGSLMIASLPAAALVRHAWIAAALLVPTGAYLIAWAARGGGLWCRTCKTFPSGSGRLDPPGRFDYDDGI